MSDLNSIRGTETACPLIVRLARVKQPLVPDLVELLVDIVILVEFRIDVIVNQDFLSEPRDRTHDGGRDKILLKSYLHYIAF
jgi:hypothetical protein